MAQPSMSVAGAGAGRLPLSAGDVALLQSIGVFGLLTAEQLTRLHTPTPHGLRSMQRRLKRLVDTGLLRRLRAQPTPRYGSAPHVFTLAHPGRVALAGLGLAVADYTRPSEQHDTAANLPFVAHTLATVDVLISAARLARDVPVVSLGRLLTERELKHAPLRVAVDPTRPARTVAVIPDAWFQLHVAGEGTYSIAVELDRGTEHRPCWQTKVAALAAWAAGPYRQAFDTDNLTLAVVAPSPARRDALAAWTRQALSARGQPTLAAGEEDRAARLLAGQFDTLPETGYSALTRSFLLTLSYVLLPGSRSRWDARDLGPSLHTARTLAAAVVRLREGDPSPIWAGRDRRTCVRIFPFPGAPNSPPCSSLTNRGWAARC